MSHELTEILQRIKSKELRNELVGAILKELQDAHDDAYSEGYSDSYSESEDY